jgi:hypothetical protein
LSTTITYCENGCTRVVDGEREQVHAYVGRLCKSCAEKLEDWLIQIPERYAQLPEYLLPSADLDGNPESKATKRPVAPAPLRLAALDLLDTRRGRKWLGTEPTDDRRGALGTLLAIANEVRIGRSSEPQTDGHVLTEADTIRHGLPQLAAVEGISDIFKEIKALHRDLGAAVGQYPPRSVGKCYLPPQHLLHDKETCACACHLTGEACTLVLDGDTDCNGHWAQDHACRGPLLPIATGVVCVRCDTKWTHNELRLLGLSLPAPGTKDKTA